MHHVTVEQYKRKYPKAKLISDEELNKRKRKGFGFKSGKEHIMYDSKRGHPWNYGLTKKTDKRVSRYSKSLSDHKRTKEHCKNISLHHADCSGSNNANFGNKWSDKQKRKASKRQKEKWLDPNSVYHTPEHKKRRSKAMSDMWKNPDSGCNQPGYWEKQRKAKCMKLNGLEKALLLILNKNFGKGKWLYVGNFKLIISTLSKRRCPDFKHRKFRKLIETYNEYDKNRTYGTIKYYKQITTRFYRKCGYEVLYLPDYIVYGKEDKLVLKIKKFVRVS